MKLTKRKGFNFFRSYFDVYNELDNDADKVAFIDALLDRQFLGVKPNELRGMAKFAYVSQVNSIDTQVRGFEDKTGIILSNPSQPPAVPPSQPPTEPPCLGVKNKNLTPTLQVQGKGKGKVEVEVEVEVEEKEKEKEKVKTLVFSQKVLQTFDESLKFFEAHLHPVTKSQINNWKDTIEKLNRIEKLPFENILDIIKRTRADAFWAKNFLSVTKLRKTNPDGVKYIAVFNEQIKSNAVNTGIIKNREGTSEDELASVLAEHFDKQRRGVRD